MNGWIWIAVAAFGGFGAVARFLLDGLIGQRVDRDFPLGTFAINVGGTLLLGLLTGLAITGNMLLIAGTATLGSYTTFSTWMLETQRLAEGGNGANGVFNVVISLVAGLVAVWLGRTIGAHA